MMLTVHANAWRAGMGGDVARLAQRHAVRDLKPQFRMCREWLEVVCFKVSAAIVSAVAARETVALKNGLSPISIFWTATLQLVRRTDAAPPIRILRAARFDRPITAHGKLSRTLNVPNGKLIAEPLLAHQIARFVRVAASFEAGLKRWLAHLDPSALGACCCEAIVTRKIASELLTLAPMPSARAPLQALFDAPEIVAWIIAGLFSCGFQRACSAAHQGRIT